MQYDEFQQKMIAWMEEHIGGRFVVKDVLKTNDAMLKGLTQIPGEKGISVSPTVYLDDIYERYMNGEMSFSAAASIVESEYKQYSSQKENMAQVAGYYTDWDIVKGKVYMNVVGAKANQQLLQQCPHRIVANDLAEMYRVLVQKGQNGVTSYKIDNNMMNVLHVTPEELHEAALVNTPAFFPAEKKSMVDKMIDMMPEDMKEMFKGQLEEVFGQQLPGNMYVLTNDVGVNGATTLLYPGMLEKLTAELGNDISILPSSLHEVIICQNGDITLEELQDMVREVNCTSVGPEEFLSDNVYSVRGKELVNCTYRENYEDIKLEDFQDQEIDLDMDMGMEM